MTKCEKCGNETELGKDFYFTRAKHTTYSDVYNEVSVDSAYICISCVIEEQNRAMKAGLKVFLIIGLPIILIFLIFGIFEIIRKDDSYTALTCGTIPALILGVILLNTLWNKILTNVSYKKLLLKKKTLLQVIDDRNLSHSGSSLAIAIKKDVLNEQGFDSFFINGKIAEKTW